MGKWQVWDSKSPEVNPLAGSTPASGTNKIKGLADMADLFFSGQIPDCAQNCA